MKNNFTKEQMEWIKTFEKISLEDQIDIYRYLKGSTILEALDRYKAVMKTDLDCDTQEMEMPELN